MKKKQYEEERLNKKKLAARKIAPGFLDTDTRILKPEQTYVQEFPGPTTTDEEESSSEHTSPKMLQPYANTTNESNKVLAMSTSPDKVHIIVQLLLLLLLTILNHSLITLNLNKA